MKRHLLLSMIYLRKISFLLIFISVGFNGCIGANQPAIKTTNYTLEYDSPKFVRLKPLPVVIRVAKFQTVPLYDDKRIIFKTDTYKRDAYHYHKWRTRPGDLISSFLARDLQKSSLFRVVFAFDSSLPASHIISGTVDEIFEEDKEDAWNAVLSISITLMRENEPDINKRIIFQNRYRIKEVCKEKTLSSFAEAMSKAMSLISEAIISDTYHALSP
ncbi:MAG: ABC-type transport auxiliary lipoprotein family protein [Desulfobacterales bacterium]